MNKIKTILIAGLISFISLMLSACVTNSSTEAWLTKGVKVKLPSPNLAQPYHDQQLLTFKYNEQENSLITLVDAQQEQITVVGLSTMGIRLFKIEFYDGVLKTEQNIFVKSLPPASQILADIMLSILPVENWQPVLPKGWQLVDTEIDRKLLDDNNQVIEHIIYHYNASSNERKPIEIRHHVFGYQIKIESME